MLVNWRRGTFNTNLSKLPVTTSIQCLVMICSIILRVIYIGCTVCVASNRSPASLRVGLYNYIPDIGDDQLASYVNFIHNRWNALNTSVQLELVTGKQYAPYGNLDTSLGTGPESFDLIETDMVRSSELIGRVVEITENELNTSRYFKANIDAVKHNDSYLGFPTLACGNFIIQVQQNNETVALLDGNDYKSFAETAGKAGDNMVHNEPCNTTRPTNKHARLIGGRIDDKGGWSLPYRYLDAVVDVEGPDIFETQIENVLNKKPNDIVIQRLKKYVGYFQDNCEEVDQEDIPGDVIAGDTAYFYGFSEILSVILKRGNYDGITVAGVLSPPFGDGKSYLLVYTDALVINKAKYELANQQQKNAMHKFAKFFASESLRTDLVMGKDLGEGKIRYLLPPIKAFFEATTDPVYKAYYPILKDGLAAPPLGEETRKSMRKVLKPLVLPNLKT